MEEIEYKLSRNNPILTLNAITKLVSAVKKAHKDNCSTLINELPEMKLLKKKCEDKNTIVSQTAFQGIVALVDDGLLKVIPTLCEFVASIPFVENFNGLIVSVTRLLISEMTNPTAFDSSHLRTVQHPFVILLKHNANVWFDVLNQMDVICTNVNLDVANNAVRWLQPVFVLVLCDPTCGVSGAGRQQAWALLLHRAEHSDRDRGLLVDLLSWLQVDSNECVMNASFMYCKLADSALERRDIDLCVALAPMLASLSHSLILRNHDPRLCLMKLDQLVLCGQEASSCVIMLLAETIESCPAIYFKDLIASCLLIFERGGYNRMSAQLLYCSLLRWLVYPSYLAADGLKLAYRAIKLIETKHSDTCHIEHLCQNEWFCQLQNTDQRVDFATELCKLSEEWEENCGMIRQWVDRVATTPNGFSDNCQLFMCAVLICDFSQEVKLSCLKFVLQRAGKDSEFSAKLLPIILFKLTKETDSLFLVELLRGLTTMAGLKENIPIVVSTLESLKREKSLQCFVLDLYLRLWRVECRCYPYLQPLLVEATQLEPSAAWKHDVAKAVAINEICQTRPELHGTELVPLLSMILNQCDDAQRSVAASFALQGITALCRADIVDVVTTWKVLAPKLSKDTRTNVVISLCGFLSIIPSLCNDGAEDEKLIADAVSKLWSFVSASESDKIVISALTALAKFNLEHLSLKLLPQVYRGKVKLPKEYVKTPVDAARDPEDVLPYIPGECWVRLIKHVRPEARSAAGDLLVRWLGIELNSYRGGIYQIPSSGEPSNNHHLHHRSVYRALTDYLHASAKQPLDAGQVLLVEECLRVLSHNYSKPLPPFNWSFLQDYLAQSGGLRKSCLALAAKQAVTSPSAKRLVANYISIFQPNAHSEEEVLDLFSILEDLCKGIPPNTLRPCLEKSLEVALDDALQSDGRGGHLLTSLLEAIKSSLQSADIHEANRALLALQVEGLLEKLSAEHELFPAYVACALELPAMHLERMSSPSLWWETTSGKIRQAVAIRSALACRADTDSPLVWLNEIVEATANMREEYVRTLRVISAVMVGCRGHMTNWQWILELLGKIQSVISSNPRGVNQQKVEYLCSVFLATVIVLSGHDCLASTIDRVATSLEVRLVLFPQALATLVSCETDKELSHLMEWLHHMQSSSSVSPIYNAVFRQGLKTLRHKAYFKRPAVVERFINKA